MAGLGEAARNGLLERMRASGARESTNIEDRRPEAVRPLTDDERSAAMAASFVDQALLGYGDYPLAGLMTVLRGPGATTPDGVEAMNKAFLNELSLVKNLQYRLRQQAPTTNVVTRGAGLMSPWAVHNLARAVAPQGLAGLFGVGGAALSGPQLIDDLVPDKTAPLYAQQQQGGR